MAYTGYSAFSQGVLNPSGSGDFMGAAAGSSTSTSINVSSARSNAVSMGSTSGDAPTAYIGSLLSIAGTFPDAMVSNVYDSGTASLETSLEFYPCLPYNRVFTLKVLPMLYIPNGDQYVLAVNDYMMIEQEGANYVEGATVGIGIYSSAPSLSNLTFNISNFESNWPSNYIDSILVNEFSSMEIPYVASGQGSGGGVITAYQSTDGDPTSATDLYPYIGGSGFYTWENSDLVRFTGKNRINSNPNDICLPAISAYVGEQSVSKTITSSSYYKLYILVKTYIYMTFIGLPYRCHYGSFELWGPIYFIVAPTNIAVTTCNKLYITSSSSNYKGTINLPLVPKVDSTTTSITYLNSGENLLDVSYGLAGSNHMLTLYPKLTYTGGSVANPAISINYEYDNKTATGCKEHINFTARCLTTSADYDNDTFNMDRTNSMIPSPYTNSSNYQIKIYNAYGIYVYDDCTVSNNQATINGSTIAIFNDNAGIAAISKSIDVDNGPNTIYLREVLEEINNGTLTIDYNSNPGASSASTNTSIAVSSYSNNISGINITPISLSGGTTLSNVDTVLSNSTLSSLTIHPTIWKVEFTASGLTDTAGSGTISFDTSAYVNSGAKSLGRNITLNLYSSGTPSSNVEVSWCNNNSSSSTSSGYTSFGNIIGGTTSYSTNVTANSRTTYLHIKVKNNDSTSTVNNYNYSFLIAVFGQTAATINMISPSLSAGSSTLNTSGEEYIVEVIWNSGDHVNFGFTYNNTPYTFDFTYNPDTLTSFDIQNSEGDSINSIDIWAVPAVFNDNTYNNKWQLASAEVTFVTTPSQSGNDIIYSETSGPYSNIFSFTKMPPDGSCSDISDLTFSGYVTSSNNSMSNGSSFYADGSPYSVLFPRAATTPGSYTVSFTAGNLSAKTLTVNVKQPTTSLTIEEMSGTPYYAGTQFRINLIKDGGETWSELNISVAANITSGWGISGTSETPTYSVESDGTLRITFPSGMTNQWSHKLIITGTNYFGQEITVYTDDITVYPVNVTGIQISDSNGVVATNSSTGDLGDFWFGSSQSSRTFSLYGCVLPNDLPASARYASWSVSRTSGSGEVYITPPSGTIDAGSNPDPAEFICDNIAAGGVQHTITASAGGMQAKVKVTPKKKSTQIIAEDASVEENSYITISIGVDGDESVTSSNTIVRSPAFESDGGSIGTVTSNGKCQINAPTSSPNTVDYTFVIDFNDSTSGAYLTKTITITVYPDETTYYIRTDFYNGGSGTDTTQIIYANAEDGESQIVAVDVSVGSRVTKYNVSAASGLLVSTNGQSSWSSSLSNISKSVSRIYIKQDTTVSVASTTFSKTVTFTAVEHDNNGGTSDSETKTIKRGRITLSQAVTNPNRPSHSDEMFKEDTVTFTVVLIPRLSTSYNEGTWSNSYGLTTTVSNPTHSGTAGAFNSTTTITCDATGSNNGAYTGSIRYYFPELSSNSTIITNTYYSFEIDILGQTSVCNALALDPSTQQIMSLAESEASVGYAYAKGSSISTINTVSLASTSTTGYSHNNKLALSYTQTGVTVTSTGIPDDSHDGAIYNISISATNELGDTITASGNVIWRIGVDGLTFEPDEYTKSVYGNTGNSIVYDITCKHNYAGQQVNDSFFFNAACNSISTSGSWWSATIDNTADTVTITTTSKNYDTNNRTVDITLYSKHGLAQFENNPDTCSITFVQNPLIIETTFDITKANGDSTTTITTNPNTITSSFLTVGQTKTFTITCSHIERETSGGQSIGSFEGETVAISNLSDGGFNTPTLSGNILTISAPDNTAGIYPDRGRTCTFTLTTSHGDSNRTESYAVTATQPGYQYGNSTILINGNTSNVSDECSSKQQILTYTVVCTYDKFVDGYRSDTLNGTWTAVKSSSSDTWYTISSDVQNNTLSISVEQNPNDDPRTILIDITGSFDNTTGLSNIERTLTIEQSGSRLEFNPARIENISVDGSTGISTDVETNTPWNITNDSSSWIINISPTGDSTDPYDASMTFDVEDNYNPNALTDYVKYRSSTSDRNGGISVDTSSGISVHLPVSQQGYTFDASMSYKLNGVSVTSIEIGPDTSTATLSITSNYDYTLSCNVGWVSFGGNQDNKFNDNDGNVFKTNTYVLTFKYNTSDARNTDITISQVRHQAKPNGEDEISDKTLRVAQGTAVGHYALSLSENSLRYDAFGTEEVLTKTIDVTSKLGGWTMDADTIQRNNNSENWFHISQTAYTFIDTADTPTQTTTISIRVNPNPDVDNGHSHTITFTHSQSGSTAVLTITQDQATVYFVYVEVGTSESENDALIRLKGLVNFVKNGVDVGIAMAPPPRSIPVITGGTDAVNKTYYLYYFYGSSPDKNISHSTTNGAMMSAVPTPKDVPVEVAWEDANSSSSNVYIINVSVNENNTTENRNGIITISGNAAPAVAKIEFTGYQEKRIYQIDLTFAYEAGVSYLGDLNGNRWEIPVYGKSYIMKIANKLEYDKLIITNIKISDDSSLNPDLSEPINTSEWATFDYSTSSGVNASWTPFIFGNDIIIDKSSNLYIKANIANYQLNEDGENRTYENDINVKNYSVQIFVLTESERNNGRQDSSMYYFVNGSGNRLVASQFSKDMYQESWQLLSSEFDVEPTGGSQKVYVRGDFTNESINKVLYSEDTGYTLMGSSDTVKNKEITYLQTILTSSDEQNIAYDVRFGIRLKDN